ncbi:nitroreductase family deazaflavin-dependent oxidoreductase [Mycobacterium paraffinicum]|uniref:nitroreductase family deazaflavin-dependent oxidoreductase n=1 Tax=Mycobacterium paraffinicum TaxID=53378 RepID=UPI000938ECC4|nr:nitroreductase family deazaflavin-dependent oxidoreductase [Mycobacterium paraffinicum]
MRTLDGEYAPSPIDFVSEQVRRYEDSDGREGATLEGRPVIILTHRGAKTGKLRKTPVMRIPHNNGYLAVASYGGAPINPAWYHNLRAHSLVEVQDGATITTMTAREASTADKAELWPVCEAAWAHFPEYRASAAAREIPIFVLVPIELTGGDQ